MGEDETTTEGEEDATGTDTEGASSGTESRDTDPPSPPDAGGKEGSGGSDTGGVAESTDKPIPELDQLISKAVGDAVRPISDALDTLMDTFDVVDLEDNGTRNRNDSGSNNGGGSADPQGGGEQGQSAPRKRSIIDRLFW